MDAVSPEDNQGSMRERELEVEIARLNAELAVFKGGSEPAEIAARFLTMAANTVDMAMADARREADELAIEVTAEAEARRDEATRVAEQVEAQTESLRVEAEHQQAVTEAARDEAQRMKAAATQHINSERARVAEEVERLAEVRSALETERSALETYHEELKRRVQELAESMVSFMTTEPPLAAVTAIDELAAPAIAPAAAAVEAAYAYADGASTEPVEAMAIHIPEPSRDDSADAEPEAAFVEPEPSPAEPFAAAPIADAPVDAAPATEATVPTDAEPAQEMESPVDAAPAAEPIAPTHAEPIPEMDVPVESAPAAEAIAPTDAEPVHEMEAPTESAPIPGAPAPFTPRLVEPAGAPEAEASATHPVTEPTPEAEATAQIPTAQPAATPLEPIDADAMVASIFDKTEPAPKDTGLFASAAADPATATPVEPSDFYDAPERPAPSLTEMLSGARSAPEAEFGGVPVVDDAAAPARKKGGLFSRVRNAEAEQAEPILPEAPPVEGGLFGSHASRLIEQTSPEQLASALADDSEEDARFRSFLDGDGENDPSRDWLLRPDED